MVLGPGPLCPQKSPKVSVLFPVSDGMIAKFPMNLSITSLTEGFFKKNGIPFPMVRAGELQYLPWEILGMVIVISAAIQTVIAEESATH